MKTKALKPDRMNTQQAADYLGLAKSTLESWRYQGAEGSPRFMKLGGRVFYRQSTLDEWLARNEVEFGVK